MVRNPYYPTQVTRYRLSPEVIDAMVFCSKNPAPMLGRIPELASFDTFWFVTVTPYGREIEPFVPDKNRVLETFCRLSEAVGAERVSWRYDPIFITEQYSMEVHVRQFEHMAHTLKGYTKQCVVSFIDLYEKTRKNFKDARSVTAEEQEYLIEAFSQIAAACGMQIHLCCENSSLVRAHVDADGCMSQSVLENAIGATLHVPKKKQARTECNCLLGADIGAYNTCGHGCLYCYANYDRQTVVENMRSHDVNSPMLIGNVGPDDVIKEAEQKSWRDGQMSLFDFI